MRTFIRIAIPVILLFGLIYACSSSEAAPANQGKKPVKTVETITVEDAKYRETIFATGKLSSREEAKLSFKTGGIIKRIHVREGQSVRKGQLLAELDLQEIQAQAQQANLGEEQAKITIENAKLALQLAERDYKNTLGLYQDSVATLEQLENVEVQLDNAKNQLSAAQKGLAFNQQNAVVADFNLQYSKITAPSNGIILKKVAEPNEVVGPGTPVFLFGSKDKAQVIRVNVTDKDIIHVDLGDEAAVQFDAYPDDQFKGQIQEIASMADPYTNTYEVEIEVQLEGKKLLSGFIGTVLIYTDEAADVLQLPIDALISAEQDVGHVFTIKDNRAIKTQIEIFKIKDKNLLVEKGLQIGDQVIISGVGYLEHDDSVMVTKVNTENR